MRKPLVFFAASLVALAAVTGCNKQQSANGQTAENTNSQAVAESGKPADGSIVYVVTDSLIAKYDLFIELSAVLQEKSTKVEANLSSRTQSLEKDIVNYQEKVQKGLVTRLQAQGLEEDLQKKQQDFVSYRDKAVGELAEEEQVMYNRIMNDLNEVLAEFNKDYRYDMILGTSGISPVLHANPALDITNEVLIELNKKYAANKK